MRKNARSKALSPIQLLRKDVFGRLDERVIDLRKNPKRSGLRRRSKKRVAQSSVYALVKAEHLAKHPLDQIFMAKHRIDERKALELLSRCSHIDISELRFEGFSIPFADQIHHRNKCNGERLIRKEFFMSTAIESHGWAENNKGEARKIGVLCPINAKPDGTMPDGSRCLTTDELMRVRCQLMQDDQTRTFF